MGGTGATISLIIAVYIFTKFKPYREVVKLATAPGIFEINEPIIFGLPIVFNIPMMIPFVALPAIQTIIACSRSGRMQLFYIQYSEHGM